MNVYWKKAYFLSFYLHACIFTHKHAYTLAFVFSNSFSYRVVVHRGLFIVGFNAEPQKYGKLDHLQCPTNLTIITFFQRVATFADLAPMSLFTISSPFLILLLLVLYFPTSPTFFSVFNELPSWTVLSLGNATLCCA